MCVCVCVTRVFYGVSRAGRDIVWATARIEEMVLFFSDGFWWPIRLDVYAQFNQVIRVILMRAGTVQVSVCI